jgi:dinuclear metal center YbgI/SA1388 family protein
MKIDDIIRVIEEIAPLDLQEDFDNSGLQVGDRNAEATGALLCTDVTEAVVDEAIEKGLNLVISHHPLLFFGLKHITGQDARQRIVAKALKHDIAIYSSHTAMDSAWGGVSFRTAEKLGLTNIEVLSHQQGKFVKIAVFVPDADATRVAQAMFDAGAGHIGDYDSCCYRLKGEGTFRALPGANPYVGKIDELHVEPETRVEVIVKASLKSAVVRAMLAAHPYEEPAFDIVPLANSSRYAGLGVIGEIAPQSCIDFLKNMKKVLNLGAVRYSGDADRMVSRVALCGGAGYEFVDDAVAGGADLYLTGDMKYHQMMEASERIIIADFGHYESEQFTKEIFYDAIQKKIPNFAAYYAEKEKNPINYL